MLELKAILLTQGMHGMVSQVEGLAKALGISYKHQTVKLKFPLNFSYGISYETVFSEASI